MLMAVRMGDTPFPEAAMWTPEVRALVGDFGSGQALSDDQYRLIEPFIPPAKPDDRHAAPAGRSVLCRAHRVPMAPCAAAPGVAAVADDLRLLSGLCDCRGVGNHPPLSGHDAA